MKALLLATTAPDGSSHQQTGSTNWILRLCKTLYLNHKITLLTPPSAQDPWIEQENISLLELPLKKTSARLPRIIASFFQGIYPSIWTLYSQATSQYLRKLQEKEFDVCWLLDDYAGIYLRDIPLHLPTVFTRHYLFSMQNNFVRGTGLRSWFKGRFHQHTAISFDRWTTGRADIVTLGTQESCSFLRDICPENRVEYLPTKPCNLPVPTNCHKIGSPRGPGGRLKAVFLADMSFIRNAEGANWFLKEVLPAMPEALLKQYHFQFIGRKPVTLPNLDNLPVDSSVEFVGFVNDLTACLHESQVAFIPVFGGNGIRLKTLTLLGTGLPTVSTPDALEGLDLTNGENVLKATSAKDFIRAFEILLDAEHRLTISRNCLHAMDKFLGEAEDADRVLELSRSITHAA